MTDDVDDSADPYQPIPAVRHEPKINPMIPKTIQLVTRTEIFISRFAAKCRALARAPVGQDVLRNNLVGCKRCCRRFLPLHILRQPIHAHDLRGV